MSQNKTSKCAICNSTMSKGPRGTKKYCSPKCKSVAWRRRAKENQKKMLKILEEQEKNKPINPYFLTRGKIF